MAFVGIGNFLTTCHQPWLGGKENFEFKSLYFAYFGHFFMSIFVMLVDRKNIAYSNKIKSQKVKKFVRETLMNNLHNKQIVTNPAQKKFT